MADISKIIPLGSSTTYDIKDAYAIQTVATGDGNGQIKITPRSGSAYNVDVKGLAGQSIVNGTTSYLAYYSNAHTISPTKNAHFNWSDLNDTTKGYEELVLGNKTDRFGRLALYGHSNASGGAYIIANNPTSWLTHTLPDKAGWIVTAGNGSTTGAGGARNPIYVATTGVATAGAVTFDTLNANRLMWTSAADKPYAGYHYANSTKIAINSSSEPTYNLYVNGTGAFSNALTLTDNSDASKSTINFSRVGYNYINIPADANLAVSVNGSTGEKIRFAVNDTSVHSYTTNSVTLGTSSIRWKALYIGTANSYGGAEQPIYWNAGVPTATSYALKATINNATQGGVAYYSTARNITSTIAGPAGHPLVGGGSTGPIWYAGQVNTGDAAESWITSFNGTTASTSTSTGAVKIAGGLGVAGQVTAARVGAGGSNTDYKLYVNGNSQFNIGTNDTTSHKKFVIVGNNRYLSIGGSGLQAYTSATDGTIADADTASLLYLQYNGGNIQIGQSSTVTSNVNIYGDIIPQEDLTYNLGSAAKRWANIYSNVLRLQGPSSDPSTSAGARIEFTYDSGSSRDQPVYISYTPNDDYRSPAGLKILGGTSATPAWLEVEGQLIVNNAATIAGNTTIGTASAGSNKTLTINGHVVINPSYNTSNSYNEGIRINLDSNGWSDIHFGGAVGSASGNADGAWLVGRRGTAGSDGGYGAVGDFTIEEEGSAGKGLTIHKDAGGISLFTTKAASNASVNIKNTSTIAASAWAHGIKLEVANAAAGAKIMGLGFGQSFATGNAGHLSFHYAGNNNAGNYIQLGIWANNDLLRIYNDGRVIVGKDATHGGFGLSNTDSTTGLGISLHNGASTGMPQYGLAFAGTATFGAFGGVTDTWATYFTTSATNARGWIFKRYTGTDANTKKAGNIAAIRAQDGMYYGGGVSLRHSTNTWYGDFYINTAGTTSAQGEVYLRVGNDVASGSANNARGRIIIYGTGKGGTTIYDGSWQGNNLTVIAGGSTTANTAHYSYITVGNGNNVSSTSSHTEGRIRIYSAATHYHELAGASTTTTYTHTFPNANGWVVTAGNGSNTGAGTSTRPVYISTAGVATQTDYSLSATVNAGTANKLAYYSGANAISAHSNLTISTAVTYSSRPITPLLRVNGILYADNSIESNNLFVCNRTTVGGGYYVQHNNVNYGQYCVNALGTAAVSNGAATPTYTNTTGEGALILGNNKQGTSGNSGSVVDNARGALYLYGAGTKYTKVIFNGTGTSGNYTQGLPMMSGNILVGNTTVAATMGGWAAANWNRYSNTYLPTCGADGIVYYSDVAQIKIRLYAAAASNGYSGLELGNNIAQGTAKNCYGYIRLYTTNTGNTVLSGAYGKLDGTNNVQYFNVNTAMKATAVYGAVWNDYAEFRETKEKIEAGRCVKEIGDDTLEVTTQRLERGCEIVSDTFGFAIGQTDKAKTPIASSGRVLAYGYESREEFAKHIGWPVCSGPNGTVSIMTEEEEEKYPSRIIGIISAVPDYEEWGEAKVKVNGRVWIRIR